MIIIKRISVMNIALGIEYNGQAYKGFQRQKNFDSVQERIEKALSRVAGTEIETFCAGRTDAGVHATGQVVNFMTDAVRPEHAWMLGTNVFLPEDISVKWVKQTTDDFHARFSATARRYRYVILNNRSRPGILSGKVSHYYHGILNEKAMHEAAQCLVGEHDFTSFRAAGCESRTPWRNFHRVEVSRIGDYVIVDITANAFLLHMVRNIVGSLLEVGYERQPVEWMAEVFAGLDRTKAGPTAQPDGLYLVDVTYPEDFGMPKNTNLGPFLLL